MTARWDRLTVVVLLAFAGYTIASGFRMGYWQGRIPGPGFAPIYIGAGLALAAVILLLRPAPPRAHDDRPSADRAEARREVILALQIVAITVAAILLIPWLGMMPAMGLLLLGLVKRLGGSWRSAAGTAVVLPLLLYLLFVRWLQVPVPKGPWGI